MSALGYEQEATIPLFEDDQGAVKRGHSDQCNPRTRHIDVKFHNVRQVGSNEDRRCQCQD